MRLLAMGTALLLALPFASLASPTEASGLDGVAFLKSNSASSIVAGSHTTYSLSYSLSSTVNLPNGMTVTDTLPEGLTFVSLQASGIWSCSTPAVGASGTISCTSPVASPGSSGTINLVARLAENATGMVTNIASLSGLVDGVSHSKSSSHTATVAPPTADKADLAVTLNNNTASPSPGHYTTYYLTAFNHGPDAASDVRVTTIFPTGVNFHASSGAGGDWICTYPATNSPGTVTCTKPTPMPKDGSLSMILTTQVAAGASGSLTSTATISSTATDPSPANNTVTDTDTIAPSAPATVPTLAEWAMILFATLLAGTAALTVQRRRRSA